MVSGGKNNRAARTDRTARQSLRLSGRLEEELLTNGKKAPVDNLFQEPPWVVFSQRPRPTMQANQTMPTRTV